MELSAQEIRNSLFHGPFNDLLHKLTRVPEFRAAWGLPPFDEAELKTTPVVLLEHPFYREMDDIELVLRFFALRHAAHYQKGMKGFLDIYMLRARAFTPEDLQVLENIFVSTVKLAYRVYGDKLFKPFVVRSGEWGTSIITTAGAVKISQGDEVIARGHQYCVSARIICLQDHDRAVGSINARPGDEVGVRFDPSVRKEGTQIFRLRAAGTSDVTITTRVNGETAARPTDIISPLACALEEEGSGTAGKLVGTLASVERSNVRNTAPRSDGTWSWIVLHVRKLRERIRR